jgi:hypothetical protein
LLYGVIVSIVFAVLRGDRRERELMLMVVLREST